MSSNNIKVHFAGSHSNSLDVLSAIYAAGGRYFLLTAYPFIESKKSDEISPESSLYEFMLPWKHVIVDSGLFTLMFGAKKTAPKTKEFIREWMHRLCKFISVNKIDASVVEVDCQKIISPEFAWDLRKEMRQLLPRQEIINVFHLEDGKDGFERLCEWSDYIAISVPELRIAQPKKYRNTTNALTRLARQIKPDIKIHLLGCTEQSLLKTNRFCTSADSSSWSSSMRYGTIDKRHVSAMTDEAIEKANDKIDDVYRMIGCPIQQRSERRRAYDAAAFYSALKCHKDYTRWAGRQD